MKFGRKLQKIFQVEGWQSALEHMRRWSHPVDRRAMLEALDPVRVADVRARYLDAPDRGGVGDAAKFSDAEYWLRVNVERAQDLQLDRTKPLRVLDLGCGAGWFLYVCQRLGHQAVGIDLDENPLYAEMIDLLGVKRVVGRIEAFTPLPEPGGKFDLVTAHCICFQKTPTADDPRREWGADAWRDFLDKVRGEWLQPGGAIMLDFNPRVQGGHYPAEAEALFRAQGARLFRSKVFFSGTSLKV